MEGPKTKLDDYYKFRAERDSVEREMTKKGLNFYSEVDNAICEIREKFEGQIHSSDNFEFSSPEAMKNFLLEIIQNHGGFDETQINEIIRHELEHAEVAKKQGHEVTFGVWILDAGEGKIALSGYLRVSFKIMTEDDRKEIAEAPSIKSELDK